MTEGVKTIIYPVKDLAKAKALYSELLGVEPYVDEAYYVGFNVEGQDVGGGKLIASVKDASGLWEFVEDEQASEIGEVVCPASGSGELWSLRDLTSPSATPAGCLAQWRRLSPLPPRTTPRSSSPRRAHARG